MGRDINRHHYAAEEIVADLRRPVVRRLLELIELRRTHPAFGGTCAVAGDGSGVVLAWRHGEHTATLDADVAAARYTISTTPAPAAPEPGVAPARAGDAEGA